MLIEPGRCYQIYVVNSFYSGSAYCQVLGAVAHPVIITSDGTFEVVHRWVVQCVSFATGEPWHWVGAVEEAAFVVPIECSQIQMPDLTDLYRKRQG